MAATILDKGKSDHRPIVLHEANADYGPTPFQFFHSWMDHDDFEALVLTSWSSNYVGDNNPMVVVQKKLKRLKNYIKVWSIDNRKKEKEEKNTLSQTIIAIEKRAEMGPITIEDQEKRQKSIKDLEMINRKETLDLAQKARLKWSVEGDENSKFYHAMINRKRKIMSIRGIKIDGDWEVDPLKVKDEFRRYFQDKFKAFTRVRPTINFDFFHKLDAGQRNQLEEPFAIEEIKKAAWDCGSDKSPGPDGFTFDFFKKFWHVVELDVVNAITYFHKSNKLPNGCNSSFITLIPKVMDSVFIKDYRPISLIGSVYKIISKLLANRIAGVVGELISGEQSAFVKGRQIMDCPMLLNEMLTWCKKHKKKTLVFKVDFEKAYDSVCWDFLHDVMMKMGFGQKWCAWIMTCLKTSMASVLVNGSPTDEFKIGRGLRQGDPLSPFYSCSLWKRCM